LTAIVLFAIVTVEFGGWTLLGLLTSEERLTPFQEQFFRAGHGHAGALLILALVFLVIVERTNLSRPGRTWLSLTLLVGILLQSGVFSYIWALVRKQRRRWGRWSRESGPSSWRWPWSLWAWRSSVALRPQRVLMPNVSPRAAW
jgi:hypothetical protein